MTLVTNWASTIAYRAARFEQPTTLAEVRAAIAGGLASGKKMRAVGSLYSFSFTIKEPELVLNLGKLRRVQVFTRAAPASAPLAPGAYIDPKVGGYAYVEAGATINDVCKGLKDRGLAPFTLGGSSGQTLIGATMTSTHGADFNEHPFPEYVVGLHVLTGGDQDVWIERALPAGSYTTDSDVARLIGVPPGQFKVLRDNDAFDAAIVSLGCGGVVVGALVKARENAVLNERMIQGVPWATVKAAIQSGSAFRTLPGETDGGPGGIYRYLEVIVNPYVTPAEAFVIGRNELPLGTPILPSVPRKAPDMIKFAQEFGLNRTNSSDAFSALINGTRLPGRASGVWQYFDYADLINVGVPPYVPVYSYELCWPVDHRSSNGQLSYLWLIDRCIAFVSKGMRFGQAFTGTISLRFCRGTSAFLGMQYAADPSARRFAHVEISPLQAFSQQTHDLEPSNRRFIDAVMATAPAQAARLHWGQGSRPAKRHDARSSVRYGEWQNQLRTLLGAPYGRFTNEFCRIHHASF